MSVPRHANEGRVVTVEISVEVEIDEASRRLKIVPGIDPITSSVIAAAPPDASNFTVARELAAWLVLTTKLHSNGSDGVAEEDIEDGNVVHPPAALHQTPLRRSQCAFESRPATTGSEE